MPEVAPVVDPERRAATSGADPTSYMSHDDAVAYATDRAKKNIAQGKRGPSQVNSNAPGVQKLSGAEQAANKKVESDLDYLDELMGRKQEGIGGAIFGAMQGAGHATRKRMSPDSYSILNSPEDVARDYSFETLRGAFFGHLAEETVKSAYNFLKKKLGKEPTKEQVKEQAEKMEKKSESDESYLDDLLGRKSEGGPGSGMIKAGLTAVKNNLPKIAKFVGANVAGGVITGVVAKEVGKPDEPPKTENPEEHKKMSESDEGYLEMLLGRRSEGGPGSGPGGGKGWSTASKVGAATSVATGTAGGAYIGHLLGGAKGAAVGAAIGHKKGVESGHEDEGTAKGGNLVGAIATGVTHSLTNHKKESHEDYLDELLGRKSESRFMLPTGESKVHTVADPAIVGAGIGALAGGKKGAAIGGAIGAVAGGVRAALGSKASGDSEEHEKKTESTKGLFTAHVIPQHQFGSHCVGLEIEDLPPAVEGDPISEMWRQQDMLHLRRRNF
jgi:hypothetical protein